MEVRYMKDCERNSEVRRLEDKIAIPFINTIPHFKSLME